MDIYRLRFLFLHSSFFINPSYLMQTGFINTTKAILNGQQVNNIYVVNVSEAFNISVMPIDNVTGLELRQIRWGNWTWSANVSLYNLPTLNSHGSLIAQNTSAVVINVGAGTVSVTNLMINDTGMYVLNITLASTNNEHFIQLASNGILVKNSSGKLTATKLNFFLNFQYI